MVRNSISSISSRLGGSHFAHASSSSAMTLSLLGSGDSSFELSGSSAPTASRLGTALTTKTESLGTKLSLTKRTKRN